MSIWKISGTWCFILYIYRCIIIYMSLALDSSLSAKPNIQTWVNQVKFRQVIHVDWHLNLHQISISHVGKQLQYVTVGINYKLYLDGWFIQIFNERYPFSTHDLLSISIISRTIVTPLSPHHIPMMPRFLPSKCHGWSRSAVANVQTCTGISSSKVGIQSHNWGSDKYSADADWSGKYWMWSIERVPPAVRILWYSDLHQKI
jgi:hypothetical protein